MVAADQGRERQRRVIFKTHKFRCANPALSGQGHSRHFGQAGYVRFAPVRGRHVSGSYSPSVTSNDRFGSPCGSVRRPGMSACARAIAKPRLGCGRPPVVVLHNVKQPASRHLPRNTSRSRAASLRRGVIVSLCLHRISAAFADHSAGLRPNLGRHQLRRRNEGAGGAPGGVTAVVALVRSRHSRLRGVLDRLRKTPLMSEDGESSIIYSLRSQQLNSYRSRSGVRARAFSCPRQGVAHYADQAAGNVPDHAARI